MTFIYPSVGRKDNQKYIKSWEMEPLVIATLAGLTPGDIEVKFYDDRLEAIPYDEPTDLVGISVETYTAKRAYDISREFRRRGIQVVLGGYHPTLAPDEAIEHADSIVIGNAEEVWSLVIRDATNKKLRKIYKSNLPLISGTICPKRDIFKNKRYFNLSLIETGRGCRFKCEFCSVTTFYAGNYYRRPDEEVIHEMRSTGRKTFFFVDDNIIGDVHLSKKFFKALIPEKIRWIGQCSLNVAKDEELLELLRESGCVGLLIGFESLIKTNLSRMLKFHNDEIGSYKEYLARIRGKGIVLYASFVLGYDHDDEETIEETVRFCREQKIFIAALNHLVPFPGTALYERLRLEGKLRFKKWWLDTDYHYGDIPYIPEKVTAEKLRELSVKARRKFYSLKSIFQRSLDFKANCRNLKMACLYFNVNFMLKKEIDQKVGLPLGGAINAEYNNSQHE